MADTTIVPQYTAGLDTHKYVPRPGFGTAGKPVKVAVNSYAVTKFPTAKVYQYDVQIGKGDEKRALLKKIWHHESVQKQFGQAAGSVLYDGNKLAWSIVQLPFGKQWTGMIDLDEVRPGRDNKHRIVIKESGTVPLQVTEAYVKGKHELDNNVLVGINFLDHLMRETPSKHFITIKRSFFHPQGSQQLDGGVEAWKGIFQSCRVAQGGKLTINVDVAAGVFWSEGSLLTTVQRVLQSNSPDDLIVKLRTQAGMRELRRIKKISFYITHRGESGKKKSFTVEGFGGTATDTHFEQSDKATGKTEKMSVAQYYYKLYNIRIRYPQLPLIITKKKQVMFPMELCTVQSGQRYPFKLNDRQTADMIKFTVQRPAVRSDAIKSNVARLDWKKDPVLERYGMTIDPEMIKTNARVLPAPKLMYGPGSQEGTFVPRDGRWDLRGKKFAKSCTLTSWGIGVCANPRRVQEPAVQNFVRQFITSYIGHGGQVPHKEPVIHYIDPSKPLDSSIRDLYTATGNKVNMKPQLLFFVLQQKSGQPYNDIKAFCDTSLGIVSQCVQSKHVEQAKAQYCSNVAMKVNAKLGGNSVNIDKSSHPMFGQNPTIYIGADVSHGGSFGGGGMKAASFASMVGSVDPQGARFAATVNTNGFRVEVITTRNIMKMIPTLLRQYKKNTNQIPQRIFYFRDGVSEGQYAHIIEQELKDIKAACESIQTGYKPVITVIVCTKRHHARFFPADKAGSDRYGNVIPGTVVDRDITHPTEYDFSIQGTARATRYTVIHDENKMPVDKFQALVYNFCYTYMRATNAVSLVPPVYYAHLASARARAHEVGGARDDPELQTTTSGAESAPPTEFEDLKPLGQALVDQMWYI